MCVCTVAHEFRFSIWRRAVAAWVFPLTKKSHTRTEHRFDELLLRARRLIVIVITFSVRVSHYMFSYLYTQSFGLHHMPSCLVENPTCYRNYIECQWIHALARSMSSQALIGDGKHERGKCIDKYFGFGYRHRTWTCRMSVNIMKYLTKDPVKITHATHKPIEIKCPISNQSLRYSIQHLPLLYVFSMLFRCLYFQRPNCNARIVRMNVCTTCDTYLVLS